MMNDVKHLSENNDAGHELDQRMMELQSLFEMSQLLNSSLNLRTILNNLLLTPMGRMMITKGLVLVTDEKDGYTIEALKGLPKDLKGRKLYSQIFVSQPALVNNINSEQCQWLSFFKESDIELLLPVISTNRTVGLIGLGAKIGNSTFSMNEIEFLSSLSNIAATAIENALMYQKVEMINKQLDKKVQELNTLFDISKELNSTLDRDKISNLLIYAIMGELVVSKCFLFLKENHNYTLLAYKGVPNNDPELDLLQKPGFLKSAFRLSSPLLVDESDLSRNLAVLKKLNMKVISPMQIQEETKGIILLGDKINKQSFKPDELEFLATLCNQAMISIENARLFEDALEKQRMEEELNIARTIQQRLLPDTYPDLQGLNIKGINIPSRQVGGDFFDCFLIDERHLALAIADVSGKGVPAALLMSNLQASLHSLIQTHVEISSIVARINNLIYANTAHDKFITFFYGELDLQSKIFTYVNAGHNYPYLFHSDATFKTLENGGIILGMMPDMKYETESVQLLSGDLILMFTDGVTEAKSVNGAEFEEWRLEKILRSSLTLKVGELLEKINGAIKEFSFGANQADDITMLALKVL
jgi:sigma-B regulation protein RsbU (phosphoserine phosphatase)